MMGLIAVAAEERTKTSSVLGAVSELDQTIQRFRDSSEADVVAALSILSPGECAKLKSALSDSVAAYAPGQPKRFGVSNFGAYYKEHVHPTSPKNFWRNLYGKFPAWRNTREGTRPVVVLDDE